METNENNNSNNTQNENRVVNKNGMTRRPRATRQRKQNNYNEVRSANNNQESKSTSNTQEVKKERTTEGVQEKRQRRNNQRVRKDRSLIIAPETRLQEVKEEKANIQEVNQNNNQAIKKSRRTQGVRRKKDDNLDFAFKKDKLKIIPLGGILEIGKNITVFEYGDDIVIVDCGLAFPEDDMLGIDLVIPDFTYLERNQDKIRGLVITHGHEDHIGSIPYLLKKINVPIYATKLTAGLISHKLEEHKLLRSTKLKIVNQGQTITLGKMRVEFIRSCHSIPDAVILGIHTPAGTVVHTGDFKIDYTPIDDERMDFGRLAELGNKGVLALMSDSTNSERKGYTMSESTVGEVFDKLFFNCTKRIVVATFASNVHRVQQIVNSAVANNRKIAVCGRSMINMITTAMELGYIDVPNNVFIDIDMIKNYTDEQLVIITTGSQGET